MYLLNDDKGVFVINLLVKMILIRYGYPPDLARLEADRVLEQSEVLAEAFVKDY